MSADPHLARILSPRSAALLVVDVQNDFCHPDGFFGKLGFDLGAVHAAVARIEALLPEARRAGVPVIFVAMEHDPRTNSPAWVARYPAPRADACVAGTWGAQLYRVTPEAGEPLVIKHRYSPFVGSNIEYLLRATERRSLLVAGVASNICVEAVLRDAFNRDYDVALVEDCAAAYTPGEHQSTVSNTRAFLGRVLRSEVLVEHWKAARAS
ncbi:MAG TPA: isochorismatase family cysteine hydrolase [Burkholderiales bacterium]|nr:isochorismatase family cysteine hydrolase [Burkholderiales bacterium]